MLAEKHSPSQAYDVQDSPALLTSLITDSEKSTALWKPAPYWQSYASRIITELRTRGMKNFRTNQKILKGYAAGGMLIPQIPQAKWKQMIWKGVESAPVVKTILGSYKKINSVYYRHTMALEKTVAIMALNDIKQKFPNFTPPEGLANGGCENSFQWNGHTIAADWVPYVSRAADFYSDVNPADVTSIIEIGPGLGLSTLAHVALNPHLKTIVNVDIVPIIYISTQFLKSVPAFEVVDYLQTQKLDAITTRNDSKPVLYQIPPWELQKLQGQWDYFFNAYSFMEMEKEICANYATLLQKHIAKGACVHSHEKGHMIGAGGQREPVTFDYIKNLFQDFLQPVKASTYFWEKYYRGVPSELCLFRKN